jgi:NhaP-type Na+/H+ or K+/H+ antiporter
MEGGATVLLQTISIALLSGIVAQVVAERLSIPSIVPLLAIGAMIGPEGLGWIVPRSLGGGLETLVSLSVAIILFEGGLRLEWAELRSQGRILVQLVTVGALVTWLTASAAALLVLPVDAWIALLLGSLVVVTGPTVIGPLLKRVRIVRRVAFVLQGEGVLVDPIGAVLAFVVLEVALSEERAIVGWPLAILVRIAVGSLMGVLVGTALTALLRRRWIGETELANLVVLASIIATFVLANRMSGESGLVAAVVSGVVLGNAPIPGRRELLDFKGALATLVISLLFVLLSADIEWSLLATIGWRGLFWVLCLMLLVRPLAVLASSIGASIPWRDLVLLSWIAPRGIVAASVASLFAIILREAGIRQGDLVQPLVFLVIAFTVVVQGSTARALAQMLGLSIDTFGVVIVGADSTGRLLGRLLSRFGREVALIDSNASHCSRARKEGLAAFHGNCLETENLEHVGLRAADSLVAVTPNSEVNYLVARLALEEFKVPRALVLITEESEPVDPVTRERHRVEHAFCGVVPETVYARFKRDPRVWRVRLSGAPGVLDGGQLAGALPLVRVRKGRAEVCGDRTTVGEGDELICLGEPRGATIESTEPLAQ